jgi:phosphoenolpyruvate carboxykinase (GTP)
VPSRNALTLDGMNLSAQTVDRLLEVDPEDWEQELVDSKEFLDKFGSRLPREIREEHDKLSGRLGHSAGVAR